MKDIREFIFVNKLISGVEELLENRLWKAYSFDTMDKYSTYTFYLYSISTGDKYLIKINTSGITTEPGLPEWLKVSIIKVAESCWTPEYWERMYKLYERK